MGWSTDGDRFQKEDTLGISALPLGYLGATGRVCLACLWAYSKEGRPTLNRVLPTPSILAGSNGTFFAAGEGALVASLPRDPSLFEREEDFNQAIRAITVDAGYGSNAFWETDGDAYVYVGFEDQFVRAYNSVPKRVRAGNVGEDIAALALLRQGKSGDPTPPIIVAANDSDGGVLASWANDLLSRNWRVSGLSGTATDLAVEFDSQDLFLLSRDPTSIRRIASDGTIIWTYSAEVNAVSFTLDAKHLYVLGEDGQLEVISFDGVQEEVRSLGEGSYRGRIAAACQDVLYIYDGFDAVHKYNYPQLQVLQTLEIRPDELVGWPGSPSSAVWDFCVTVDGGTYFEAVKTEGKVTGDYIKDNFPAIEAAASSVLSGGALYSIVVNVATQEEQAAATTGQLSSGTLYPVVIETATQEESPVSGTGSLTGGSLVLVVVETATQEESPVSATGSLSGGSLNAV